MSIWFYIFYRVISPFISDITKDNVGYFSPDNSGVICRNGFKIGAQFAIKSQSNNLELVGEMTLQQIQDFLIQ